jgi:hypothetical protein
MALLFVGAIAAQSGFGSFEVAYVLGANVFRGEEAEERRILRGGFDRRAAVGFFAFDDANDSGDDHACFLRCLDSVDGGRAGGTDIVDNDDAGAFTAEAFDATAGAVSLFCFAHQEAVKKGRAGLGLGSPGAGCGDIGDDGVGTHGETADSFGLNAVLLEQFEDGVAGEPTALGMEGGSAAIDVVIAGSAGRQLELAEFEADAGEKREKLLRVGWAGHQGRL